MWLLVDKLDGKKDAEYRVMMARVWRHQIVRVRDNISKCLEDLYDTYSKT